MAPIIVRIHSYNDQKSVWSARSALKNEYISINENFAAEVEYRRRLLNTLMKAAKQSSRFKRKAFINGDTLVMNNQSYSVEDLHKPPHDLHPSNLSKKENDQWLIFGGILSQHNCLSNFYKSKFIHYITEFDAIEAFYILLYILHYYGISDIKLKLLKCYRSNRQQNVKYNVNESGFKEIKIGVT